MMRTLSTVIGLLGLSIQDLHSDLFVVNTDWMVTKHSVNVKHVTP